MTKKKTVTKKKKSANPEIVEAISEVLQEELAPLAGLSEKVDRIDEELKRMKSDEEVIITDETLEDMGIDPESKTADEDLTKFIEGANSEAIELVEDILDEKGLDLDAVEVIEEIDMGSAIEQAKSMRKKRNKKSNTDDPILPEELAQAVANEAEKMLDDNIESPTDFDDTEEKDDDGVEDEKEENPEDEQKARSIARFGNRVARKGLNRNRFNQSKRDPQPRDFSKFGGFAGVRKSGNPHNAYERLSSDSKKEAMISYTVDRFFRGDGTPSSALTALKTVKSRGWSGNARSKHFEPVYKALNASTHSQGGAYIPEAFGTEIIKYIYAETALDQLLVTKLPLDNGNLTIPRNLGGGKAFFVGEGRPGITKNDKSGDIRLSAKELLAQQSTTKQLLKFSDFNIDQQMFESLMANMGEGVEVGTFFGKGSEFSPLGIFNNKAINKIDMTKLDPKYLDSNGFANGDFLTYAYKTLLRQRVSKKNALAWVMNYDVWSVFYDMKTPGSGEYIHRAQMDEGLLYGIPFAISEIDEMQSYNAKGAERGRLILADWSDLYMAENTAIETNRSDVASFTDDSGEKVSAFENRLVVIQASYLFDSAVAREQSFLIVDNFKIG